MLLKFSREEMARRWALARDLMAEPVIAEA